MIYCVLCQLSANALDSVRCSCGVYDTSLCFCADVGADVLDLAETMVASADGLVYEPVSLIHLVSELYALRTCSLGDSVHICS